MAGAASRLMGVSSNIVATYRRPRQVVRGLLSMGPREDRALAYLMAACGITFVAQWPRLAREAHLTGAELNMLLGASLMGLLFIAPLLLYGIAAVARLVGRILGGRGSGYGARLALFWALLAASPIMLLYGLVAGFIGPGPELNGIGVLWCACFCWFWISGSLSHERVS